MAYPLRGALIAASLVLIAVGSATAATSAGDPEATVVDSLVVTARLPGPAWWRVSSATSTVYVLGIPGALPKGIAWDESVASRRIEGANAVILPPAIAANAGDSFAILGLISHLRTTAPMEDSLPPNLRARFDADRARLGGDPRTYSHWMAAIAALQMVAEYRRKNGLDSAEPTKTLRRLASAAGVRVAAAATYKAVPLFKAVATQAPAVGPACLADALDEIEAGPDPTRAAAEAWAKGDVRAALSEERGYERCANSIPEGAALTRAGMRDTTGVIADALAKPGHAVAAVRLRDLLAPGGVLQQLQARGFKVAKPDASGD